ncbi:unnamed protein product [Cuscuta epithymum]|uniref:RNase H type-1 domain-containing protein n=1 Tax=Cuscuta epithymum TaxID=186058 RepID=A0AAV0FUK3_9ASTE|nr:unnamed protein product [Cuscuta epithymum]
MVWDDERFTVSSNLIINGIKNYLRNWCWRFKTQKWAKTNAILYETLLRYPNFKQYSHRFILVKWIKPTFKYKINVDAAFLPQKAGGAVMRNQEGLVILAIGFLYSTDSVLGAEFEIINKSLHWFVPAGYSEFILESESMAAISNLHSTSYTGSWSQDWKAMRRLADEKNIIFTHWS